MLNPAAAYFNTRSWILYAKGFITIDPNQAWPIYCRTIKSTDGPAASDIWSYQPYTENTVFAIDGGIDADVAWLKPRDKERLWLSHTETHKPA